MKIALKLQDINKLLLGLLLLISSALLGQNSNSHWFQVKNSSNGEAVSFASIIDRTHNIQYITDELGYIHLSFTDSTLIKISAIGFHDYYYYLSADKPDTLFVQLLPKVYELKEFAVLPYPTEESFKKAFINMELEEENVIAFNLLPIELMRPKKHIRTDYQAQDMVSISFSSPISAFYNLYSKRAKSAQKLKQLQGQDIRAKNISKKYNKELVRMLTGIQKEERLENMMGFCIPSDSFILNASDYEIAVFIIDCFGKFLANEDL